MFSSQTGLVSFCLTLLIVLHNLWGLVFVHLRRNPKSTFLFLKWTVSHDLWPRFVNQWEFVFLCGAYLETPCNMSTTKARVQRLYRTKNAFVQLLDYFVVEARQSLQGKRLSKKIRQWRRKPVLQNKMPIKVVIKRV